ncbi:MAG: lactate utilization protein [Desulfobacteraceae bacterium]|jgi:L-lactate dehydrogenase complex protein LldG
MMNNELIGAFTLNAEAVSMTVQSVSTLTEAFEYTVNLCDAKEACQLLLSGCETVLSEKAAELCDAKSRKVIAAPGLSQTDREIFQKKCQNRGIDLIVDGLRSHLAGIDVGFTIVDFGIAETGTVVLNCENENTRLATMISEIHIAVLPVSHLKASAVDLSYELKQYMANSPNYLAFITGASRTADIERVLAIGVHGPLEVHVLLWENK